MIDPYAYTRMTIIHTLGAARTQLRAQTEKESSGANTNNVGKCGEIVTDQFDTFS
ncbi:hypothetical protein RBA41_25185 [Massilia sp. CCM 9210]|uniref:hypothetical protein n=1 Tax=Massilia scottii TaxID=3057166 RepID=UPI002796B5E8|nr:hypothetical protein [Massilia sp. CCM 9210]MDQ1816599.1 hypothetical protein [Massilia sp. CCM 9210]